LIYEHAPDIAVWEAETEDGSHRIVLTKPMLEQIAKEFRKVAKQLTRSRVARRAAN
jgi:hypothetical protein